MKKMENFRKAFHNLKEIYKCEKPYEILELTGAVSLFEICFEQAWKAMKEQLEKNGLDEGKTGSPKLIIKTAYSAGMINDEDLWLDALNDRNNVAHAYNEGIAVSILENTKERYYDMFSMLLQELESNWA